MVWGSREDFLEKVTFTFQLANKESCFQIVFMNSLLTIVFLTFYKSLYYKELEKLDNC